MSVDIGLITDICSQRYIKGIFIRLTKIIGNDVAGLPPQTKKLDKDRLFYSTLIYSVKNAFNPTSEVQNIENGVFQNSPFANALFANGSFPNGDYSCL